MTLLGQYQFDFSMFCDSNMWCFHLWGLTDKFWRGTKSTSNGSNVCGSVCPQWGKKVQKEWPTSGTGLLFWVFLFVSLLVGWLVSSRDIVPSL